MSEPRTHYQISVTARQAVGLFAGLLLALGLAYFLGLMTGYARRDRRVGERAEPVAQARPAPEPTAAGAVDAMPPVETGVAVGAAKTDLAVTPLPLEPTTPATLQPFDDSAEDEAAASAPPASRTSLVGSGPAAAAPSKAASGSKTIAPGAAAGKIWVQAASLSSHEEANGLSGRLSKHGFHTVVTAASGPKGRVY
ncbi:MAG TPA: hypothetical protein VGG65_05265, partial [Thermoanaerobaculia bacterium]